MWIFFYPVTFFVCFLSLVSVTVALLVVALVW